MRRLLGAGSVLLMCIALPIPAAAQAPVITLDHTMLAFAADLAGHATSTQVVLIGNGGEGTMCWTATSSADWLLVAPDAGNDDSELSVMVDTEGLGAGTYGATVTVASPTASNSPQLIEVQLDVYASTGAPFGDVATPITGSTVQSEVPFTGWALDDLEVDRIEIYRQDSSLVYVGDAAFVDGARPDVEAAYPGYPLNYRAGWGFMLQTRFLPDGGNGSCTFEIHAVDVEGNDVTLGSTTITVDNDTAVKPFGAIDTPQVGGVASGTAFVSWGWALTPQPNSIPVDGSTIDVYVDGVNLGHPEYNVYREDVATLFPGYANSNGAGGYFVLDTTTYENGLHTMYWAVEDSAGNTDGVGGRSFRIVNEDPAAGQCGHVIFTDGFELGNTSRWTGSDPP